jgi:8-oxo-dGTP pyrophosphatase MutT (NUDIX family)
MTSRCSPSSPSGWATSCPQVHKWFLLGAGTEHAPVRVDPASDAEFRSWRWTDLSELAEDAVAFRRPVYRRLAELAAGLC